MIARWFRALIWEEVAHQLGTELHEIHARLSIVERWVKNLDTALWKVDQAVRTGDVDSAATQVHDVRAMAARIRQEVMAKKPKFPMPPGGQV
jgi:hypothetical protein